MSSFFRRGRDFWRYRSGLAELLIPFSVFYYIGHYCHRFWRLHIKKPVKLSVPVICIGNVTAGGAGKTPVAIALAKLLSRKYRVAFISRGYGGRVKGPVKVEKQSARQVGDEPLLLTKAAPCYVGKSRVNAAKLAIKDGADLLIMDDGMQHYSLHKDITLMVVDSAYGFGNGLLLPAGPLREKLSTAFNEAQAAIVLGENELALPIPVFKGVLSPVKLPAKNKAYIAFAGIGRPEKFFELLNTLDYTVKDAIYFPDHHHYTEEELTLLARYAESLNATLMTTEKDAVKLSAKFAKKVKTLPVEVKWENEKALSQYMANLLPKINAKKSFR